MTAKTLIFSFLSFSKELKINEEESVQTLEVANKILVRLQEEIIIQNLPPNFT